MEEPASGIMSDNPFRYRGYYYDTSKHLCIITVIKNGKVVKIQLRKTN